MKYRKNTVELKRRSEYDEMITIYEEAERLKRTAYDETMSLANRLLGIANKKNDIKYQIFSQTLIAYTWNNLEGSDNAIQAALSGLALVKQYFPDDIESTIKLNNTLIYAYMNKGNLELAVNRQLKCLVLKKNATAFVNLTTLYERMGDNETALKYATEGLGYARMEKSAILEFKSLYNLGFLELLKNNLDVAESWANQLMVFFEKRTLEDTTLWKSHECLTLNLLAEIQYRKGNYPEALEIFDKAIHLAKVINDLDTLCELLLDRANTYQTLENFDAALADFKAALHYAEKSKSVFNIKRSLKRLIAFYESQNQLAEAYPYLKKQNALQKEKIAGYENDNLTKIINDRELEIKLLEEKTAEIKEQNAILKQFAYIISHDLREPIRGITGFASLLNKKYAESLDETANDYLRFILSEANSMNRNLARLLKYTTIEKGVNKVKVVDISQIITELKYKYKKESFEIDITCKGEPLKMQPKHAKLLLEELIENAVQFKKENETCRVEIQNELKEGYYHLSVKDHGIGIDAAYHDKVFKIFNKINKLKGSGAGVGLAICQRIAQLYKGQISVESAPNQFSTFCIKIAA